MAKEKPANQNKKPSKKPNKPSKHPNKQDPQPQRPKVNVSQVTCGWCVRESQPGENFVQCDECSVDYHFECVEISEISENDSFKCPRCTGQSQANQTQDESSVIDLCDQSNANEVDQPSSDQSSGAADNVHTVTVDVHRPYLEDLDDSDNVVASATRSDTIRKPLKASSGDADRRSSNQNDEQSQSKQNDQSHQSVGQDDRDRTIDQSELHSTAIGPSTQLQSDTRGPRSVKEIVGGSIRSSRSTSSISSSKELQLRHAQDQFELQELIDNEILNTRLEAIRAKELRAKKLLEEIYKSRREKLESRSGGSTKTSKSHVASWVKEQQDRVVSKASNTNVEDKIEKLGFDMSISLDEKEIEIAKKQVEVTEQKSNANRNSTKASTVVSKSKTQTRQPTKSVASEPVIVPASRSTMLPPDKPKIENPTFNSLPPEQPSGIPPSSQSETRNRGDEIPSSGQSSYKKENVTFHPRISQSYSQMYPPFLESRHRTLISSNTVPPSSNQSIFTSAIPTNPIMSFTTATNSTNQTSTTLNTRTFPMYRTPTNLPVLTQQQIAARQALPKWLPKFDGNPYDWPNFIKRFENSTALCGFCLDENLERLDKCLEKPARDLVKSQLMMPECVPEIIQILFERYGRPELVMKATLDVIRNEPIIKQDRLEQLSNYGYKVHSACNIIEQMGLGYYLYNPELVQEILGKLPHQTRIDFAVYSENIEVITLRTLANWMRALSRMINRISPVDTLCFTKSSESKGQSDKNSNHQNHGRKEDNSKNGYLNVHDGVKSTAAETNSGCLTCDDKCKRLEDCSQFKQLTVNKRWELLKQHNLCRRCLKQHSGNCVLDKECGVNGCVFKHNPLMHKDKKPKSTSKNPTKADSKNANQPVKVGSNNAHFYDDRELFRTAIVEVHHNDRKFVTFALLDEASSFTLMERETANQIDLTGNPETICLLWTNGMHRQEQSEMANLEISGRTIKSGKIVSTDKYPLREVNIVEKLELPEQTLPIEEFKRKYKHLTDLPIIGYENAKPTILIGLKNARLAVPLETVEGNVDDPIATRSRLGWQVYGTSKQNSSGFVNTHRVVKCPCQERDDNLHNLVKSHFTIENFGVVANAASMDSKENEKALQLMKEHTIRKGDRFETQLLWKNDTYTLPDSYPMAMKRLACLENKGNKVIETINESIKDYVAKGYVTKLTETEAAITDKRTWYLPIFTVINPKKPEKLRTVFDAAAKVKGLSMNSVLFTGPDLSSSMVDILRRFREHRIGVNGDIKEMYHQVLVNEKDRNSQRFIWRNGDKSKKPDVYVMNVLTFGATCSPSLAQFVKNLNATEYQNEYPRAADAIIRNHYIDDLLDGADSEEEAIQLLKDVRYVHKRGGFEMRNFKSNSSKVLHEIGETSQVDQRISMDIEATERILGMFWETKSDCFTFSLKYTKIAPDVLNKGRVPTKRELLSLLMSIYDPLGLLSYYLIHVKILLQDVWRSKIKWDDPIPEHLKTNWNRWLDLLPNVEKLKIPRWYSDKLSPKTTKTVQLHTFVDASAHAYSAIAYLRIEDEHGVTVALVGSKARVTPLKYLSTPRQELLASVLGTRFSQSIRAGISTKVDRRVIWSDSTTVLTWLQSEHQKYNQFVAHRIGEILESTELDEWRWVPTDQNIADDATKWKNVPSFESTSTWFTGPDFLSLNESEWPKLPKK